LGRTAARRASHGTGRRSGSRSEFYARYPKSRSSGDIGSRADGLRGYSPEADANEITRGIGSDKTRNPSRQVVATHGKGHVTADLTPINKSGVQIGLRFNNGKSLAKLEMRVKSRIGSVEVLAIDRQEHIFVLGENIPTDTSGEPFYVRRSLCAKWRA
jgi:hypothetical protein